MTYKVFHPTDGFGLAKSDLERLRELGPVITPAAVPASEEDKAAAKALNNYIRECSVLDDVAQRVIATKIDLRPSISEVEWRAMNTDPFANVCDPTSWIATGPDTDRITSADMMWKTEAQNTAAALAEANFRIVALEAELRRAEMAYRDVIAGLTSQPAAPKSNSDVLGACMKADRTLDSYGR